MEAGIGNNASKATDESGNWCADGSYEKLLEAENHKIRVLADKRISDLNDMVNTEVQISTSKNKERLEIEVLVNKKLMEKIATT